MLQGESYGGQLLFVAVVMRVAKNPMQCAWIRPLIFQELESRSCRGHKVMILAASTTVKKLPITPATPSMPPRPTSTCSYGEMTSVYTVSSATTGWGLWSSTYWNIQN